MRREHWWLHHCTSLQSTDALMNGNTKGLEGRSNRYSQEKEGEIRQTQLWRKTDETKMNSDQSDGRRRATAHQIICQTRPYYGTGMCGWRKKHLVKSMFSRIQATTWKMPLKKKNRESRNVPGKHLREKCYSQMCCYSYSSMNWRSSSAHVLYFGFVQLARTIWNNWE